MCRIHSTQRRGHFCKKSLTANPLHLPVLVIYLHQKKYIAILVKKIMCPIIKTWFLSDFTHSQVLYIAFELKIWVSINQSNN